jgi:hypothetical protein
MDMTTSTQNAIADYISSLNRIETAYAATFAHWLETDASKAEEQAEGRRGAVRSARAKAIRNAILRIVKIEAKHAAHMAADPHCTCNDCMESFDSMLEQGYTDGTIEPPDAADMGEYRDARRGR